jgi:hypothetical protein
MCPLHGDILAAGCPRRLPYTKRGSLLTRAEMRFFRTLVRAVPDGMAVFIKFRLMDVLFVDDGAWKEFGARAGCTSISSRPRWGRWSQCLSSSCMAGAAAGSLRGSETSSKMGLWLLPES